MLDLLEPFPRDARPGRGLGSGWTAAILGDFGGADSRIFAVERIPRWSSAPRAIDQPWVSVHRASSDALGLPELAPFDRILVSAMAEDAPAQLMDQLADGGIMVAPWNECHARYAGSRAGSRSPNTAATPSCPSSTRF